jgi:CHAT domain-containing protein/tetratricopeptide (TPR) repeat protein
MGIGRLLLAGLLALGAGFSQVAAQTPPPGQAVQMQGAGQEWFLQANKAIGDLQAQRDYAGALARSEELLARVVREFGASSFDAAVVLSTQGHIFSGAGKLAEAASAYERSLALMQALFGPVHQQVAIMQANLARCYGDMKRIAEAKELFEKAMSGAEQAQGPDSEAVRQVLGLYAAFNANHADKAVAQTQLERLLQLTKRVSGPRSTELLGVQVNFAALLASQARMSDLDGFMDATIASAAAEHGETDTFTIQAIANFARIYGQLGRNDKAEAFYQRVVGLAERKFGPEHQFTVANFILLANYAQARGGDAEAAALYAKALGLWGKAFGPDNHNNHNVLLSYGVSLRRLSRFEEAEKAFRDAIDVSVKALGPNDAFNAKPRIYLAGLYRELGRHAEAEALYKTALDMDRQVYQGDEYEIALTLDNLSVLYLDMGRYDEAENYSRRALDMFERLGGSADGHTVHTLNNLSAVYKAMGRTAEALSYLERALGLSSQIPALASDPIVATLNDNLANVLAQRGERQKAAEHHRKAYDIFLRLHGPDSADVGIASHNIASLYFDMGDPEKAKEWYGVALRTYAKVYGPKHSLYATSLRRLAEVHTAQKAPDQALPLLQEALRIAQDALPDDHPDLVRILVDLGSVHIERRSFAEAYDAYKRACDIIIRRWQDRRTDDIRETAFRGLMQTGGKLENQPGQDRQQLLRQTFDAAQWIGNTQTAAALTQMSARFAATECALAQIVRGQQDHARELAAIEDKLTFALAPVSGKRDDTLVGYLRRKRDDLLKALASFDETLGREFPGYAELSRPAPLTFDALRALLRKDELFIQYAIDGEGGQAWVISKDKISSHRIDLTRAQIEALVSRLRCGLDESGWSRKAKDGGCETLLDRPLGRGPLPFDLKAAHDLYKALIGPFEKEIAGKQLLIVPAGALTSLPLQVLLREPPAQQFAAEMRSYSGMRWLGTSNAITILPAASSLKALRQFARKSAAAEPYIGYGDPKLTGVPGCPKVQVPESCAEPETSYNTALRLVSSITGLFRSGQADTFTVSSLCPLPDTAHELKCVAKSLGAAPAAIHTGMDASETLVKAASRDGTLANYRIVHFATHGLLAGETQQIDKSLAEPALVLSPPSVAQKDDDGLLTASEVAQLKLNSDWVILSACNTAAGDRPGAEALSGLTRAFFYAGTRSVLVSHWPVNSTAAVALTTGAFNAMNRDKRIGRGEAMRRSIAALVEGGRSWEAHPAYWAPFVIVGEGAAADTR